MAIKSGKLRHIVAIQIKDTPRGVDGSFSVVWIPAYIGVPMSITPISGREYVGAGSERGSVIARGECWYPDDLLDPMILHNGRVVMESGKIYDIDAALPDETHSRWLNLMLKNPLPSEVPPPPEAGSSD